MLDSRTKTTHMLVERGGVSYKRTWHSSFPVDPGTDISSWTWASHFHRRWITCHIAYGKGK